MSLVKVQALDAFDGHQPGDFVEVPERQAQQLIQRGLAKMAGPVRNKMAQPVANKANPSQGAGKDQQSSASPVARASRKTTARRSASGAQPDKTDE